MRMPTYREWEKFWDLHVTPEFRDIDARTNVDENCNALSSLDSLRGFFSSLAGVAGDATVPESVNAVYVGIANHLAGNHEFDMMDEDEYEDGDLDTIRPVIDQLFASLAKLPMLVMVRRVVDDERHNYN